MHWKRKWQPIPVFLPRRIPGTGEPGGLPSMGSHRAGHYWSDLAAAAAASTYWWTWNSCCLSLGHYRYNRAYFKDNKNMVQNVSLVFDHQSKGQLDLAPCFRWGIPLRDTWEEALWNPGERAPHSSFLSVTVGVALPLQRAQRVKLEPKRILLEP